MSWLIETALVNSAVAILMAAAVAMVSRWIRRPAVLHALWLLVLVKLVTPPLVPIDIPVPSSWAGFAGVHESTGPVADQLASALRNESVRPERVIVPTGEQPASVLAAAPDIVPSDALARPRADSSLSPASPQRLSDAVPHSNPAPPTSLAPAAAATSHAPSPWTWVPLVALGCCLAGSLTWWSLCAGRIVSFRRRLLRFGRVEPELSARVTELAKQLGISTAPQIRVVDDGVAPMLWGCGRWSWIVLPRGLLEKLDDESRDAMLLHELAHFSRGDHWVRLLELLVTGLYWWHPVVWWVRRQLAICEEECCDARVVSLSKSPRRYAEVLLETLDFVAEYRPVLAPVTSGMSDVPILERRLRQIMAGGTPWSMSRSGRWALRAVVAVLPCNPLLMAAASRDLDSSGISANQLDPAATPLRDRNSLPAAAQLPGESALNGAASPAVTDPTPTDHPLLRTGPSRDDWGSAASDSGRFRLAALSGGRVHLNDATTGRSVDLSESGITAAAFLPRERMLVGTKGGEVRVYDATSAAPVSFLGRHRDEVTSLCVSPDGRLAVTGSRDGSVFVWDQVESGAIRHEWKMSQPVSAIRCSPDGRTLAVACGTWQSTDNSLVLIDLDSGRVLHELAVSSPIGALGFPDHGAQLLAADWNGVVTFWDVATGQVLGYGRVPKDAVSDASFSPDNDALAGVVTLEAQDIDRATGPSAGGGL